MVKRKYKFFRAEKEKIHKQPGIPNLQCFSKLHYSNTFFPKEYIFVTRSFLLNPPPHPTAAETEVPWDVRAFDSPKTTGLQLHGNVQIPPHFEWQKG